MCARTVSICCPTLLQPRSSRPPHPPLDTWRLLTHRTAPSLSSAPAPYPHTPTAPPFVPVLRPVVSLQTYPPWRRTFWAATPCTMASRSTRGWSTCRGLSWGSSGSTRLRSSTTRASGWTLMARCGALASWPLTTARSRLVVRARAGLPVSEGSQAALHHERPCTTSRRASNWTGPSR
jgi:hypothetical protein